MKRKIILYVISFVLVAFFSDCARYKNILYFQDVKQSDDSVGIQIYNTKPDEIILQNGDNVYLNIFGIGTDQISSFEKQSSETGNFTDLSLFIQGYMIDQSGEIELPVIGKVKLAGLSLSKARETLQEKVNQYLIGAIVDLKLLSYQVSVLGEVKRPATYNFYKRDVNLIEVLSKAGDLTSYGDARNIMVIRRNNHGSESVMLDLTKSSCLVSQYYWIKPGDIIYVKPLKAKVVGVNSPTIGIVLSGLSTLLLLLTYMRL